MVADLYDSYTSAGDPGGGRDATKFYAFDGKQHADAINALLHGQPRTASTTSSATPAINVDACTQFNITAQAVAITSLSSGITGTPTDGQKLVVRIKDNGTAQAITYGASWRAVAVTLPTVTIPNGTLYIEGQYNSADSVWDVITVRKQIIPAAVRGTPNSSATTSVAIPTHQPGDLILIYAVDNTGVTLPAPPAPSGTVPAYVEISDATISATARSAVYQFVATANNHTSGTWTGTTAMAAIVVKNPNPATPIGGQASATSPASATQSVSPAIALTKTDGTSALLLFYNQRLATAWGAAPAGCTQLLASGTICIDSKNDTTVDGAITQLVTASTSATSLAAAVEILAAT